MIKLLLSALERKRGKFQVLHAIVLPEDGRPLQELGFYNQNSKTRADTEALRKDLLRVLSQLML